jgi:polar amino acid transport system substrate-binding protein
VSVRAVLLVVCAAAALAGCATVSDRAQDRSLAALLTEEPAPLEVDHPKADPGCRRGDIKSAAPSPLPRPGHMPRATFMRTIQRRKPGKLIVGVDQNSLGLGYYDPDTRRMVGFDIEVVREVARAIFGDPHRIVFKAMSTQQRVSAVEDGDVDIVASAFSISCTRIKRVRFSSVYLRTQQKLLVTEKSKVSSLSDPDLLHKKVCATLDSTSLERLDLEKPRIIPDPVKLRPDCLVLLQEGAVSAITSDDAILIGFRQQDPQTKIVGGCLQIERWAMAINKAHPEFVRFVNGVLARMRRDDTLARLRKKWLKGITPPTDAEAAKCAKQAPP